MKYLSRGNNPKFPNYDFYSTVCPMKKDFTTLGIHFGRISLFIGIVFISNTIFAQRIPIRGKIVTTENVDVDGINIINLTSKAGAISDEEGNFKIPVALNDSLSISAIHVEETIVVVGKEQLEDKKIVIHLSEKTNLLQAVTLRRALTGYIGTDTNIIPTKEPITATSLGLPLADLPKLSKAESLLFASSSGPVNMIIGAITGETKRLKERVKHEKTAEITESLIARFPITYYVDVLEIDQFKVYSFLFYCEQDPEYQSILNKDTMNIIQFLKRKSVEFRKRETELD